jgi:kynureninase
VLAERFDALDADPAVVSRPGDVALENVAGFLALSSPVAGKLCDGLREHGVFADYRGNMLRLGPAPYLSDGQLIEAVTILGDVTKRV